MGAMGVFLGTACGLGLLPWDCAIRSKSKAIASRIGLVSWQLEAIPIRLY